MRYLNFFGFLVVVIVFTGCVSDDQKTLGTPAPTPSMLPGEPIIIPSTTQLHQEGGIKNGMLMYRNPEKFIRPEDLNIGDLIQMSINDSRFDKNHGVIIENISPHDNQFLIKQIVKFESENKWFGINTITSVRISPGALMRDYPYKIRHASEPLRQKCLSCTNPMGGSLNNCAPDAILFRDCHDPRGNRTSAVISAP